MLGDLLHHTQRLAGAESGPRRADHRRGRIEIVERDRSRTVDRFDRGQRSQGNHVSAGVANRVLLDRLRRETIRRVGLRIDVERPAELRDLVDVGRAQVGLEGTKHVVDLDPVRFRLAAVQDERKLRHISAERGERRRNRRLPSGFSSDRPRDSLQSLVVKGSVAQFDLHLKAGGQSESLDRRGEHNEGVRLLHCRDRLDQVFVDGSQILGAASFPGGFQNGVDHPGIEKRSAAVYGRRTASANDDGFRHARDPANDIGQGLHRNLGPAERGCVRELHGDHDVALIFGGQKSRRCSCDPREGERNKTRGDERHQPAVMHHAVN